MAVSQEVINEPNPGMQPMQQQQQQPMQGQQQQQYPMVQGMAPAPMPVAPGGTFPMVWPQGVGITDRKFDDPEDCSCPGECSDCAWGRPMFFCTSDMKHLSEEARWSPNCCMPGWEMRDADVLGQKMTFEGKETCGVESCWEPELHIFDNERAIGKIIMLMPWCQCCTCSEIELAVAKDASGNPRFARMEHPWCPNHRYLRKADSDCCGWWEYQWPVKDKQLPENAPAVAQIVYRFHYNFACHPIWVGFRSIPGTMGPDDQKLLLGMAIVRLWRAENEQKREDEQGQGDGNPVY